MMNLVKNILIISILSIVSLNVRSLLNMEKFEKVKELCKKTNVILLQETNWKMKWKVLKEDGKEKFITIMEMGKRSCGFI